MKLFFRDDDLGWDKSAFQDLLAIFKKHGQKLNAAAIPSACSETYQLNDFAEDKETLQIHVHGYSHLDHEVSGKKSEFGSERSTEVVLRDLNKGYEIIETLFSTNFFPAFTPPWNRITEESAKLLPESNFKVLSRDGKKNFQINQLQELNVHLDLHTSKKPEAVTPTEIWDWCESHAVEGQPLGIMLHHNHMTKPDYIHLDKFLECITKKGHQTYFFSELVND